MYIINYHNIIKEELDEFDKRLPRIDTNQFEKEIKYLSNNFQIVSTCEIINNYSNKAINLNKVAITFDDGCYGVISNAVPILKKYNIPASLYIITDFINKFNDNNNFDTIEIAFRISKKQKIDLSFLDFGIISLIQTSNRVKYMKYIKRKLKLLPRNQKNEHVNKLLELLNVSFDQMKEYVHEKEKYKTLSWENVISLKKNGYEIGSHTHTHPTLSMIEQKNVTNELQLSYDLIKKNLQISNISLAYPHGTLDHIGNSAPVIAENRGYSFALTTIPDCIENSKNKFMINRVTFEEFILCKK